MKIKSKTILVICNHEKKASESYSEKPLSKDKERDTALKKLPSLDKSRSYLKNETENTLKLDTKNIIITSQFR